MRCHMHFRLPAKMMLAKPDGDNEAIYSCAEVEGGVGRGYCFHPAVVAYGVGIISGLLPILSGASPASLRQTNTGRWRTALASARVI